MSPLRPGPATAGSTTPATPPDRAAAGGSPAGWSGPVGRGRLPDPASPTAPGAPAQLPTLTLPEGGAAIRGMGEALEPVSLRGTSGLRVPIAGTSARGRDPGLGLTYSSGQGNSAFGLGWDLPLPGIVRKTERGLPRYTDDDRFVLLGTDDLVRVADEEAPAPFAGTGEPTRRTRYRPRTEGSFTRVERHRPLSGAGEFWATYSTGNVLTVYGRSPLARIADPEHPERVFSWLPEDVFDDRGDHLHYRWVADDARGVDLSHPAEQHRIGAVPAQRYLREVAYLNAAPVPDRGQARPVDHSDPQWRQAFQAVVVLDYGDFPGFGPGATPAERPGVEPAGTWSWRADRFSSYRAGFELRTQRRCRRFLTLHRFPAQLGPDWQLVAATELGYDDDPVAARLTTVTTVGYAADGGSLRPPALTLGYQPWAPGTAAQRLDPGQYAPMGVQSPYQLVDLDGDGAAGILLADGPSWLYQANLGDGRFAPPTLVATAPTGPPERAPAVASLFADGRLAVTDHDGGTVRYAVRDPQTLAWEGWRAFPHSPVLDWSDPRVRQVDLDGDGVSDILVHEAESLAWHRFTGVDGWEPRLRAPAGADEAAGPRIALTAPDAAVLLADMTGDGLDDIVRVTADSVCYWPNLGYARFGARVTMGGAPVLARPADFRPGRVRLADVDGTGPADLVYLGSDGVRYWPNQAGNGWGPVTTLAGVVVPEPTGTVHLVDLLGRGTLCLVLSDSDPATPADALRYIDLMPGGKPGLLTSLDNGRGLRTTISYASSTQYALRDRREGAPWSTHLPVPVHVVAAVTRIDDTTGVRNTCSYRYRDGYYDIAEREFRGFGCVSQADTDTLRSFLEGPGGSWLEQPETLPPQVTVCWYHTGSDRQARPGRGVGDVWEPAAAARPAEALRALRGSLLREASYALDGGALARYPYAVTEHAYRLRVLEPGTGDPDRYAVTVVLPAESTHTAYERAAVPEELWYPDPAYLATLPAPPVGPGEPARTSHSFSLAVNDWGQVERSLDVAYGRSDPAARPAQRDPVVTSTEADFGNLTSAPGDYRIGVPLARRDYQVRGAPAGPFNAGTAAALAGAPVVPDGTPAPAGASRSRLAESRYRYWDDTAGTELPAGSFGRRALGRRVLAATVTEHTVGLLPATNFTADGHYLELSDVDGPATRWASSPVACPDPARFYQPVAVVDSFGLGTFVEYDTTSVLATSVLTCPAVPDPAVAGRFVPDPAVTGWNRTSARYDYRLLQPVRVTDPHGSTAEAEYDALGALVRSRRHGRAGEGSPPGEWDSEFSYRLDAWTASRTPLWMSSRVREEYAPGSAWRTSIRYLDGGGRPLLSKVEAEPGPAPYYGPDGTLVRAPVTGEPLLRETAPVRWLGNGRMVYDGKGRPVSRYDPYFAPDERYEDEAVLATTGQPVVLRYDPAGRISRVDYPDGSYDRIELTPWSTTSWDRCDTVLDSAWYQRMTDAGATPDEQRAAVASAAHAGTPGTRRLDPAGRVVEMVERDGLRELVTTVGYDGAGRPVAVTDPRGVTVAATVYDLAGRPVIATSADGGEQRAQWDAAGRTVRTWIGWRGADFEVRTRSVRDRYGRDRETWVLDRAAGEEAEVCRVVRGYGDDDIASATPSYLLGQAHQVFDGAGVALTLRCDFLGRVVESARRFASRADTEPAWDVVAAAPPAADRTPVAGAALEPAGLPIGVGYDALGRPVRTTNADGSVVEVGYGAGGLTASVRLTLPGEAPRTVVDRVVYDVLRRRELVAYGPAGSVAQVRAEFDAVTRRLSRIAAGPSGAPPGSLQDLRFGYDATGNLLWVRDQAQQTRFFANTVVSAERGYTYDDRYQLVAATGREAAGTAHTTAGADRQPPVRDLPDPGDLAAVVRYQETYRYDDAGNLTELRHAQQAPGGATWVRTSTPEAASNRLASTTVSGDVTGSDPLAHDARGNLTTLGYLDFTYDWGSRPRRVVVSGNVTAYYQYAADGTRVRSAVHAGAQVRERRYLGGCEYDTVTVNGTRTEEVRTVRVSTGDRVALLVERSTVEGGQPVGRAAVSRYQLGDLLDSTVLELDDAGNPLTYEEFHPYGTTAYESRRPAAGVSRKRYRFTAKERDEETGLSYHGARYYAPWLGRWLTPDPAGLADGANRYSYCQGRPTSLHDPDGRQSAPNQPAQPIEDAGAGPQQPITDAGADPAVKKDAPPGGGVKEGGTGGIEKYEYVGNPNRIEAQEQAVQGAKAGFVNTAVDTATTQLKSAVRAPVKQATGGVIPDVVLDELPLLKGIQHRIDLLGESLKLDVPQSEAGGAGYVGGVFLFFFAQNLAVGLAGKVGGGVTAPTEAPPAEPPPTARFNVGTSGGKPIVVFGEEAPTFGYNPNAAPRPIDPTTFGTGPGSKALAGTPGGPLVLSGVDDTAIGVYQYRLGTGQQQLPFFRDIGKVEGTYYATHAEAKAYLLNPNATSITVSKPPCIGCIQGFRYESQLTGKTIDIHAPTTAGAGTWTFNPQTGVWVTPWGIPGAH